MTLGYHGRRVTLEDVRLAVAIGRDGVTAGMLVEAARYFGLCARAVTIEIEGLTSLTPGAILFWEFRHFVVFDHVDTDCVVIVDPAKGERRVQMQEFGRAFTGVAILLEPSIDFQVSAGPPHVKWGAWQQILRRPQRLIQISVSSLTLQIFALASPLLLGLIVDRIVPQRDYHLLLVVSLAIVILGALQAVTSLIRSYLLLHLRSDLDARISLDFLEHFVRLPYSFFQQRPSGDLMTRLHSNAVAREILTASRASAFFDGSIVSVYLAFLFAISPGMAGLALSLGSLQVLLLLIVRRHQRELAPTDLSAQAKCRGYEAELFAGIETLKSMGLEGQAVDRWSHLFIDTLNVSLARGRVNALFDALMSGLAIVSSLSLLTYGTYSVLNADMSLGTMLALNAMTISLLGGLSGLVGALPQAQVPEGSMARVIDVLDTKPEQQGEFLRPAGRLAGHIILEDISFRYAPTAAYVLRTVSAEIRPKQHVAFVGPSGSGKSTLIRLLIGLYLPTSGRITFDGVALSTMEFRSLRRQIGVVTQQPRLFEGSIRRNIALAEPNMPLHRVIEAARLACIHDEILAMPMGYETVLTEGGFSLSGGQRQRVALARALVNRPHLLLLDEATSQLDATTEMNILENLEAIQVTTVISAHRLSSIIRSDLILVLDNGTIAERGTHRQLSAADGPYRTLLAGQMPGESADRLA